jgi:predicted RNA-binding protein with PIN domain
MALHYILDGYNIIKSGINPSLSKGSLEEQRNRLISLVRDHQLQGSPSNAVTIVFDGPATIPHLIGVSSRCHVGNIEIIFSEGVSADARIEEIVSECRRPSDLLIVSNDRGIRRRIGGTGAKVMEVAAFLFRAQRDGNTHQKHGIDNDNAVMDNINEEFRKKWLK